MAQGDLPRNLRLLCGYGRSVSDVCRKAGINRQQFNKYLSGQATPSLRSLRLVCDFFGVEESEILMDYASFSELVRRRPPRLRAKHDPLSRFVDQLAAGRPRSAEALGKYRGFYYCYTRPEERAPTLLRSLVYVHEENGSFFSTSVDVNRPLEGPLPRTMKYKGIVVHLADRLMFIEREVSVGDCVLIAILFTTDYEPITYLTGLITGIMPESSKQIESYRTVYEYLGRGIDARAALKDCGRVRLDDPEINDYIRRCTSNDMAPDEAAFVARS